MQHQRLWVSATVRHIVRGQLMMKVYTCQSFWWAMSLVLPSGPEEHLQRQSKLFPQYSQSSDSQSKTNTPEAGSRATISLETPELQTSSPLGVERRLHLTRLDPSAGSSSVTHTNTKQS